jgi:hypothetical protein
MVGVVPGLGGGKRPEQVRQVAVTVAVIVATAARASICVVSHVRGGEGTSEMIASWRSLGLGVGSLLMHAEATSAKVINAPRTN